MKLALGLRKPNFLPRVRVLGLPASLSVGVRLLFVGLAVIQQDFETVYG